MELESQTDRILREQAEDEALRKTPLDRSAVSALARHLLTYDVGTIWDCNAGRGDVVKVLQDHGLEAVASGENPFQFDYGLCPFAKLDFIKEDFDTIGIDAIVADISLRKDAEAVVRRALTRYRDVRLMAFLIDAEWAHGDKRADLFGTKEFSDEIKLAWSVRPRHRYSWFLWDRNHTGPSRVFVEQKHVDQTPSP